MALGALVDAVLLLLIRCFLGPWCDSEANMGPGCVCFACGNCFLVLAILTMGAKHREEKERAKRMQTDQKNGKQSTKHIKLWLLICWKLVL